MSIGAIVLVMFFAFLATFIQRVTGFGFGIVFMTVAPFVMPSYGEATALSGMLAIVCALSTGIRMFKFLPWRKLVGINRFACNPESLPKRSDTESLAICRRFCNFAIGSNLQPKWPEVTDNQPSTNVKDTCSGYPVSAVEDFDELYSWLHANNLDNTPMNNVGDPFAEKHYYSMNTFQFEKEVIEYFAPKYGFRDGEFWGIVSHSGTDGNAHGIYFGCTVDQLKGCKPSQWQVVPFHHYAANGQGLHRQVRCRPQEIHD